jgi:two-component system invasion response regulator UvrY
MIRILIADDHAIVRKGMKQLLLESYPDAVVGEAENAESLINKIMSRPWDIVISDLSMPGRSGLEALKQIKQTFPNLPVLIMSMYPAEQYAARALKAGASGYLGKDSIHEDLIHAVKKVLQGKKFITALIAETLVHELDSTVEHPTHTELSDREFEVLKALASGKTISEIALRLSLSVTTVSTYRSRILKKMNMKSNAELARYAFENGLVDNLT